jgi:hypothetical protein
MPIQYRSFFRLERQTNFLHLITFFPRDNALTNLYVSNHPHIHGLGYCAGLWKV